MAPSKHLPLIALASYASANFVSPGLEKCMTVGPFHEGESGKRDAVLTPCTLHENQDFGLNDGTIMSKSNLCLQADEGVANAEVHLIECSESLLQQWDLTEHGYIKLRGTEQCLDVKANEKADGTWETFEEIKQHESVHLQVYDCHDFCTDRVNQLWSWAPITGNDFGVADVQHSELGPVAGNFVSPGLAKCLDVGGDQSLDALATADHIDVHLTTCTDEFNQNFQILDGEISVPSLGKCLVAEAASPNANIALGECSGEQKWKMDPFGYVSLVGTELCMDVKAKKKVDGTYESWEEIKTHDRVNVHLYNCHEVTTERVNQLWEWSPVTPDSMGTRPECSTAAPETLPATMEPAGGSMPLDVEDADKLVTDNLWEKNTVGRAGMSSVIPMASAAVAALFISAAALVFAQRRRVSAADLQTVMSPEE